MENKIKGQRANIARFFKFCESVMKVPEAKTSKGYLEGKNRMINALWTKIDTANDEINEGFTEEEEVLVSPSVKASFEAMVKEYELAFNQLDEITVHICTALEKLSIQPAPQVQPLQLPENLVLNTNNKSNLKLKPIEIPIFSGDYKKWISFRSMFDSMIHNSKEFSKLQKIHYLKSCLTGEAERIVSQFDITEQSYDPAYEVITERFHNEVILVDTHIICILAQPDLTTESSNGLKELMDVTTENLRALKSLGIDTDSWDPILLLLLVQKLDSASRRLWEQNLKPKIRPTIQQFLDFLATRFHALGCQQTFRFSMGSSSRTIQQNNKNSNVAENRHYNSNNYKQHETLFPPKVHQSFHNSSRRTCPVCSSEQHSIFSCEKFRGAEPRIRIEMGNLARLCQRCLRNHQFECNHREGCRVCGGNHHTFLHIEQQENSLPTMTQQSDSRDSNQSTGNGENLTMVQSHHISLQRSTQTPTAIINLHHVKKEICSTSNHQIDRRVIPWDANVLLATAIVLIRSTKNQIFYPFRCLLDQGGEASHISESTVQRLGLTKNSISVSMCGLGGVKVGSSSSFVEFEIGSKYNQSFLLNVQAVVVPKVTNPLPSSFVQKPNWKHLEGLQLADPEFYKPAEIDIILGTTVYGYLLLPGLKKAAPNCLVAQNTELGWILSGASEPDSNANISYNYQEAKADKK